MLMAIKNIMVNSAIILPGEFLTTPKNRTKKFKTYETAAKYARELFGHEWTKYLSIESEWWNSSIV
jgi:hypothetical protein